MSDAPKRVFCCFCGKSNSEVQRMIVGCTQVTVPAPDAVGLAAICNGCVAACVEDYPIPAGLIHLSGPRRMIAGDIGAALIPSPLRGSA